MKNTQSTIDELSMPNILTWRKVLIIRYLSLADAGVIQRLPCRLV